MTKFIINGKCAQHDVCHCFVSMHIESACEADAHRKFIELVNKNDLNLCSLEVDVFDLSVLPSHKTFWKGNGFTVFSTHWPEDYPQNLFANFTPSIEAFAEAFR